MPVVYDEPPSCDWMIDVDLKRKTLMASMYYVSLCDRSSAHSFVKIRLQANRKKNISRNHSFQALHNLIERGPLLWIIGEAFSREYRKVWMNAFARSSR